MIKDKLEGIGWFTYETLKFITRKHPEHTFVFLFDRPYHKDFLFSPNVEAVVIPPPAQRTWLWYPWFEVGVRLTLKRRKPDLFLSPDGFACLSSSVPSALVIHDLGFEHYPEYYDPLTVRYLKHFFPKYLKKAERIATVSEYSKVDIVNTYHIDPGKIDVVLNGADEIYAPVHESKQKETKRIYSKGCDYFIFVGALQPRKNLVNLFKAFDDFKKSDDKGIKLMIVGRKGWSSDDIYHAYKAMEYKKEVIFTGRVSNIELKHLYGAALALTFIPYFEGFGIPVVEAQQCHCPVISSNVASMPEVVHGSALMVNPFSVTDISGALKKMATDPSLRKSLIEKSKVNVKRFSWEITADKLWNTMIKTLEN